MIFVLAIFFAWFIESLIEYLKQVWGWIKGKSWWIALLLGLIVAWSADIQIVNTLVATLPDVNSIPVWLDYAIGGIAIGRGANFLNSLIEYFYGLKKKVS